MPFQTRRFLLSMMIPTLFVVVFWLVKGIEWIQDERFYHWGIYPRTVEGLRGILFAPFLHSDLNHLTGNTVSFFILSVALFYFYPQVAPRVFWQTYLIAHLLLWMGGRESWHIGASVLIYGFAAFLFISGLIRKYIPLMAISLFVVFWYGGMVWHLFPMKINDPISWEGHLFGAATGAFLAVIYRKQGPARPPWTWEVEEEPDDDDLDPEERYWEIEPQAREKSDQTR